MFDRIKRSFDLVRASAQVLRQDNHLLVFPMISAAAWLLVVVAFAMPVFGLTSVDGIGEGGLYSIGFLFYVVQYFVIFYFNTALVGAVMIRLDGGSPTLADGLRIANARLRAIQERLGFVGRLVVALIGASWALATFLVVPIIVTRDSGPLDSISESTALLKRTWGENIAGHAGLGAAFGPVYFGLAGGSVRLALALLAAGSVIPVFFFLFGAVVVLALLACVLFQATLTGIYSAVLYRYAQNGSGTIGFGNDLLASSRSPEFNGCHARDVQEK